MDNDCTSKAVAVRARAHPQAIANMRDVRRALRRVFPDGVPHYDTHVVEDGPHHCVILLFASPELAARTLFTFSPLSITFDRLNVNHSIILATMLRRQVQIINSRDIRRLSVPSTPSEGSQIQMAAAKTEWRKRIKAVRRSIIKVENQEQAHSRSHIILTSVLEPIGNIVSAENDQADSPTRLLLADIRNAFNKLRHL